MKFAESVDLLTEACRILQGDVLHHIVPILYLYLAHSVKSVVFAAHNLYSAALARVSEVSKPCLKLLEPARSIDAQYFNLLNSLQAAS